jgi:hypothetical protein
MIPILHSSRDRKKAEGLVIPPVASAIRSKNTDLVERDGSESRLERVLLSGDIRERRREDAGSLTWLLGLEDERGGPRSRATAILRSAFVRLSVKRPSVLKAIL